MNDESENFCEKNDVVREILEESSVLEENDRPTPFWCICVLSENLLLTSATAVTPENLDYYHVTCVINVAAELPQRAFDDKSITFIKLPLFDISTSDILSYIDSTINIIHKEISSGGRVLVHCVAGISRSATFCIAYFMKYRRMTLLAAYNHIKKKRTIIKPNCGFFKQLIEYERMLYGKTTVSMVYNEAVKMEIPDVYDCDYVSIVSFRRKRRDLVRRH